MDSALDCLSIGSSKIISRSPIDIIIRVIVMFINESTSTSCARRHKVCFSISRYIPFVGPNHPRLEIFVHEPQLVLIKNVAVIPSLIDSLITELSDEPSYTHPSHIFHTTLKVLIEDILLKFLVDPFVKMVSQDTFIRILWSARSMAES